VVKTIQDGDLRVSKKERRGTRRNMRKGRGSGARQVNLATNILMNDSGATNNLQEKYESNMYKIQGVTEKSAFILTGNRTLAATTFLNFFFSKTNSEGF
jgi:hypothetical protein